MHWRAAFARVSKDEVKNFLGKGGWACGRMHKYVAITTVVLKEL